MRRSTPPSVTQDRWPRRAAGHAGAPIRADRPGSLGAVSTSPITLTRLDPDGEDRESLLAFFTRNEFPFHVVRRPTAQQVQRWIDDGAFRDEDNDSYWVDHDQLGRIGFFRLEDLTDGAPVFDLRLDAPFRGRGLASTILRAGTDLVFECLAEVHRFEGQTRADNLAMR